MHPAVLRVCMAAFAAAADVLLLTVLMKVGDKSGADEFCLPATLNRTKPCWDWSFDENSSNCMFNLLFAATILLEIGIFVFFLSSVLKCLYPECVLTTQRSLFCRCISRYSCVALNLTSSVLVVSFIAFALVHRNASRSCHQSADLMNSCISQKSSCLLLTLLLIAFLFTLLATLVGAWDARFWYVSNREEEEREKIYQSYKDYNSIQDINTF